MRVKVPPLSERAPRVVRRLLTHHHDAYCVLTHKNAYELLVAVILSAQCTDKRVNEVTPALFKKYPTVQSLAKARRVDIEQLIHSTGFYRNKAKSLSGMAKRVVAEYKGEIPDSMEQLITLPGVARKTASVVLGTWFDKREGFPVDTHALRIAKRLGWTRHTNQKKVEQVYMRLVPKEDWPQFAHVIVFHGRRICEARSPKCGECPVSDLCPSSSDKR